MVSPRVRSLVRGPWLTLRRERDFEVRELLFPSPVRSAVTLLHLTDLHLRADWPDSCEQLLRLLPTMSLDAVCVTGDWIEDKFDHRPALPALRQMAERLSAAFPGRVYSCVGNHDGDLLAQYLVDAGVTVLLNEQVSLAVRGSTIDLIGLTGVAREDTEDADLERIAGRLGAGSTRIVLTHYPDVVRRLGPIAPHLTLAGHTHGGQVCLPRRGWRERGGRALITHDSLDKSVAQGLHRIDGRWLHIGRGFGCSALRVRAFCPAEVTCVRLVPEGSEGT
jgi:predicted MPP superfamily phosphohydrolase